MGPDLIVVLPPSFDFLPGIVQRQKPMSIQAFGSKLAVEEFDEGIVRWLARATEVQRDVLFVGPTIQYA